MNRIYIFFFMVFGFCACGRGKYFDKEKWQVPWRLNYYRLKGSPLVVRESLISEAAHPSDRLDDSSLKKYDTTFFTYSFNREGDLIGRRVLIRGLLASGAEVRYDGNGMEVKSWVSNATSSDTIWYGNRALGSGWFKSYSSHPTKGATTWLTRFQREGNEETSKGYEDSNAVGRPDREIYSFYDGQRLLKRIVKDANGLLEQRYFHSVGDSPDSVEWIAGRRVAQREIFRNNRWGDPVLYLKTRDRDTLDFEVFEYMYDDRGNWTRRRDSTRAEVTITARAFEY
jgi:hypothetical protein